MSGRGKLAAAIVVCSALILVSLWVISSAGASSSPKRAAGAPGQLVHAYPLGPQRLCCRGKSGSRPVGVSPPRPARTAGRSPGGHERTSSSTLIWVIPGVVAVLLLAAAATITSRRRRSGRPAAPKLVQAEANVAAASNGGLHGTPSETAWDLPGGGERRRDGGDELAYRRGDEAGDAGSAFNLGVLLHRRGDLAGAVAAYERAEQRGDPDAAFNLGVLLYESGDLDGAEAAWRRSVERRHARASANLGFLLQRRGDLAGALAAHANAERWTEAEPPRTRSEEPSVAAELAYRRGDEAGDAGSAFNLGVLLHRRGDLAGAVAAYERAEQRGDPDAAFNLGVLLYESGDLDGAEAAWRRSVERRHARASANLGFLLQRRGDLAGALAAHANAERWTKAGTAGVAAAGPRRDSLHTMSHATHAHERRRRR